VKILFVHESFSSFVIRDLEILRRNFDLSEIIIPDGSYADGNTRFSRLMSRLVKGFFFLKLIPEILRSDLVFSWWANLNSFYLVLLCKIVHRKSIIVVGGYEVAYVPEINYGGLLSSMSRIRMRFILRNADRALVVSNSSRREAERFLATPNIRLVHNGVDVARFQPDGERNNAVITVGRISETHLTRKGLKTFAQASRLLPDVPFLLIGKHDDSVNKLKEIAGPNVKFTGYVSDEELLQHYQTAKVYCQLSAHEGFGVSLGEAMACGCVPVGTRRYAVPEVIGDTGFYAVYDDPESAAEAIEKALNYDIGRRGVDRIVNLYSMSKREESLVNQISEFMEQ
jgi:glycosyltransferase involved in cell wall biosynthesis